MGEVLGMLAGGGMLLLIGCLVWVFLVEIGAAKREDGRRLLHVVLLTLATGGLHLALGALVFQMTHGGLGSAADYQAVFRSSFMDRIYALLEAPAFTGPLTGVFVYLGHFLGVLFGKAASGGLALCWGFTCAAVSLIFFRARSLWKESAAWKLVLFTLCMPFVVFFFLPGWASLALLLIALAFYFSGKRLPAFSFRLPNGAEWVFCAVCALSSAFVTALLALGRLK